MIKPQLPPSDVAKKILKLMLKDLEPMCQNAIKSGLVQKKDEVPTWMRKLKLEIKEKYE